MEGKGMASFARKGAATDEIVVVTSAVSAYGLLPVYKDLDVLVHIRFQQRTLSSPGTN